MSEYIPVSFVKEHLTPKDMSDDQRHSLMIAIASTNSRISPKVMMDGVLRAYNETPDCKKFFQLVNEIESREWEASKHWNPILRNARQAERCKAYEKMFYLYLDGVNVS